MLLLPSAVAIEYALDGQVGTERCLCQHFLGVEMMLVPSDMEWRRWH